MVAANGSMLVYPGESEVFELVGMSERGVGIVRLGVVVDGGSLPLQLSEFLASNDEGLLRSDGSSPDWVEVWNPNPYSVNAGGYRLSDDAEELDRFELAPELVAGDGFLVIDASSRPIDGVQAAGFALEKNGGELIWSDPSGVVLEQFVYPHQSVDVSYGLAAGGVFGFFTRPTPGDENGGRVVEGFVSDTQFSVRRGQVRGELLRGRGIRWSG